MAKHCEKAETEAIIGLGANFSICLTFRIKFTGNFLICSVNSYNKVEVFFRMRLETLAENGLGREIEKGETYG